MTDIYTQTLRDSGLLNPSTQLDPQQEDLQNIAEDQKASVKQSMAVAVENNPDREAKILQLSRKTGITPAFIGQHYDSLLQTRQKDMVDYDEIVSRTPGLTRVLQDQTKAGVAKDDLNNMGMVEHGVHLMQDNKSSPFVDYFGVPFKKGWNEQSAALGYEVAGAQLFEPAALAEHVSNAEKKMQALETLTSPRALEYQKKQEAATQRFEKGIELMKKPNEADTFGQAMENAKNNLLGAGITVAEAFEVIGQGLLHPDVALQDFTQTVPGLILPTAISAAVQAAMPEAPVVGAALGFFMGSLPASQGNQIRAELIKRGVDVSDPSALQEAFSNAPLMDQLREESGNKVIPREALNAAALLFLGRNFGKLGAEATTAEKAVAITKDVATTTGVLTGAHEAGKAIEGEQITPSGVLQDYVNTLGQIVIFESPKILRTINTARTSRIQSQATEGMKAAQAAKVIDDVQTVVAEMPTLKRDPDLIKELIRSSYFTEKEPETIYHQSDEFENFAKRKGISPVDLAESISPATKKSYLDSKNTGALIETPFDEYAVNVAKSEYREGLLEISRVSPDAMSLKEASEFAKELPKQVAELVKPEEPQAADSKVQDEISQESSRVKQQLIESGRSEPEASASANIFEQALRSRAEVRGLTPQEIVGISRVETTGPVSKEVRRQKANIGQEFFQSAPEKLAKIYFDKDVAYIDLLRKANLSSWQHEIGHNFLEWTRKDVEFLRGKKDLNDIQKNYLESTNYVLDWLGAKSFDKLTTEQHEKFADGWVKYLAEGKAPSKQLESAFQRFTNWMVQVYKSLRNIGVDLTPEVREFMGRLVATDQQIKDFQADQIKDPILDKPVDFGLTGKKLEKLKMAEAEAETLAEQEVLRQTMKKYGKPYEKFLDEQRPKIAKEIENELYKQPDYRAKLILETGRNPDGSDFEVKNFKLDRESLKNEYDKDTLKKIQKSAISDNGFHPEEAAGLLGFESGPELVSALAETKPVKEIIDALTEAKLAKDFPDPMTSGTLPEAVRDAMHNEGTAKVLRLKLEHMMSNDVPVMKDIIRRTTIPLPSEQQIRRIVDRELGKIHTDDISPYKYYLAERRARKTAGELLTKGDFDGSNKARREELLNHELYRSSVKALEYIDKNEKRFNNIVSGSEAKQAETRDIDLVNATKSVLAKFGYGNEEKTPDEHLKNLRKYDPEVYEFMTDMASSMISNVADPNKPTYDEFRTLAEGVKGMMDQALRNEKFRLEDQMHHRDQIANQFVPIISRAIKEPKGGVPGRDRDVRWNDRFHSDLINGSKAWVRIVEHWADAVDHNVPGGFAKKLVQTIIQAGDRFRADRERLVKEVNALTEKHKEIFKKERISAPELGPHGYIFDSTQSLMGAILHRGNMSNMIKNLVGRGWATMDANGIIDLTQWNKFEQRMWAEGKLTKAHYDYAQGIWDVFESLLPDSQKVHKENFGVHFTEISKTPFDTPFGRYAGGYAPAKIDRFAYAERFGKADLEDLDRLDGALLFPTPPTGFTISRNEKYMKPLVMDLSLVRSHIDEVLRFSNMKTPTNDFMRLLRHPEVSASLSKLDKNLIDNMLIPWLSRSAKQQSSVAGFSKMADNMFRFLRKNTAQMSMFLNVSNATQNLTDMPAVFLRVEPKYVRDSFYKFLRSPKQMADAIIADNPAMSNRLEHQIRDLMVGTEEIIFNQSKLQKFKNWYDKHAFFLQKYGQNMMDIITWDAAANQAIEKGFARNQKEAKEIANSDVRLIHGSSNPESIARFQVGTPAWQFMTMFTSFWNNKANLIGSKIYGDLKSNVNFKKGFSMAFLTLATGYWAGASVSEAIQQTWNGKFDRNDDGAYVDDILYYLFGAPIKQLPSLVPIAGRVFLQPLANKFLTKTPADDNINISPLFNALESASSVPVDLVKLANGNGNAAKTIRDVATATELFTGLPAYAPSRPLIYATKVKNRDVRPSGPLDYTRGLLTGASGNQ